MTRRGEDEGCEGERGLTAIVFYKILRKAQDDSGGRGLIVKVRGYEMQKASRRETNREALFNILFRFLRLYRQPMTSASSFWPMVGTGKLVLADDITGLTLPADQWLCR